MGAPGGTQGSASPSGFGTSGSFASYLSGYGLRVPAIAGITQPLLVPGSWLDFIAEDYGFNVGRWVFAREHYTGEVAAPWRIAAYLIRKKVGETIEAFEERVLLADYTPYFGAVVDTLAGMLIAREDETDRKWGREAIQVQRKGGKAVQGVVGEPASSTRIKWSNTKGPLGDVGNPDTTLGRLWVNADGQSNSWLTLWQLLATELTCVHTAWLLVDGGSDGTTPRVKLIQPESVQNWRYDDDGVLVEALMKEHTDIRGSIQDNPRDGWEAQWVYFDVNGWSRWHKVRKEDTTKGSDDPKITEVPEKIGEGAYKYVTRDGKPTIPMYRVQLPLKRNVGYLMARKCNAIFNKESERDHLLRFATFPFLNIIAEDAMFKRIEDRIRLGSRILQAKASTSAGGGAHHFIAPPSDPAASMSTVIKEKVEAFYATAFREFASSTAHAGRDRVTATEVLAQREVGLEAFLAVIANAIDNAENNVMWFVEQTVYGKDKSKWGQAKVERPKTFGPINPASAIEQLKMRYVGAGPLPGGRTAQIDAIKRVMEHDGVEFDESEIAEAIDANSLNTMIATVQALFPAMPAEMKAEMIAQWGEANGYGKHDELVTNTLAELKKQDDAAQKAAQAKSLQQKPFGGQPGGDGAPKAEPAAGAQG